MDVTMVDGDGEVSQNTSSRERDLIKAVRSLDQTGPGDNGQHIEQLWSLLTSVSSSNYFAAEESALRWLLKTMKTNSDAGETLRRFPLTWRILECVFQRIPLFSLAKSLADRKFMAILQQTLKGLAKPSKDEAKTSAPSTPKKRKRTTSYTYDLDMLKSLEGCVGTCEAILWTLQVLLKRLDQSSALGPNDHMGAEHIKALFSQPANEVAAYLAPILSLCDLVSRSNLDQARPDSSWMQTLSSVWDLRLQGHADALEAATFLSRPGFSLLGKLYEIAEQQIYLDDALAIAWRDQLETFMLRNLVLPAKAAFVNRQDLEIPITALEVSRGIAVFALPVLFRLASKAPRIHAGSRVSKAEDEWTEQIFSLINERVDKLDSSKTRSSILETVLEDAEKLRSRIKLEDLRSICEKHVFKPESTDWPLLALVARCDPDVFLLSDEGARLLGITFDLFSQDPVTSGTANNEEAVNLLLEAIIGGFVKARDLGGFLKQWYQRMAKCDPESIQKRDRRPVWFSRRHMHTNSDICKDLQESMTPRQLVKLLEWVEEQKDARPEATLLLLDTITQSLDCDLWDEYSHTDLAAPILLSLFKKAWLSEGLPSDIQSMRWPIIAKVVGWVKLEEIGNITSLVLPEMRKVQENGMLDNPDTLQALQCESAFYFVGFPDGSSEDALAQLLTSFSRRLAEEKVEIDSLRGSRERSLPQRGSAEANLASYLDFSLGSSPRSASRLLPLLFRKESSIPNFLENVLSVSRSGGLLAETLNPIFSNETIFNEAAFVEKLIEVVLETLASSDRWDDPQALDAMKALCSVPDEALSRQQRERIMSTLHSQRRKMKAKVSKVSPRVWALVLALMAKVMRRPTFYNDMAFEDLAALANGLSKVISTADSVSTLATSRLIQEIAASTFRQMDEHYEEWGSKYFSKAKLHLLEKAEENSGSILFMSILTSLISTVSSSSHFSGADAPFSLTAIQDQLASDVRQSLESGCSKSSPASEVNRLLLAVGASNSLPADVLQPHIEPVAAKLEKASLKAIAKGQLRGWSLRTLLIRNAPEKLAQPRPADFSQLFDPSQSHEDTDKVTLDPVRASNPQKILDDCIDAVIAHLDHAEKLSYIEGLLSEIKDDSAADGQLLAIHRVVSQMKDDVKSADSPVSFDLATAHSRLTEFLLKAQTPREFCRCAELSYLLLDQRASSMTQWNIETTMSAISTVTAGQARVQLTSSPAVFTNLCNLASVIIRRHRLRLEDHYHILLTALESLLGALARNAARPKSGGSKPALGAKHAGQFARLVTLVTEPSTASVSRAQYVGALDSATDAAKRTAGRHMYLVLMQYVKLQLEVDVPAGVREALEPAMHSIFDVTPPEVRKILNDAMDVSGRAILREMFKRYTQFGKWTGV